MPEPTFDNSDRCNGSMLCAFVLSCPATATPRCMVTRALFGELHSLCDALENIADGLPKVDRLHCLSVAGRLLPTVSKAYDHEERIFFPVFEANEEGRVLAGQLHSDHVIDEYIAQELTERLLALGHGDAVVDREDIGIMLRSFFTSMRRHIALEDHHLRLAINLLD